MKKNNNRNVLGYKLKVFVTWDFCILSFLLIICSVILLLFALNIRIYINLDNKICENINSILLSITTGYWVSFFVYLLTIHIPNYTQALISDRIISDCLSLYKDLLLDSFGGLAYILGKKYPHKTIEIPAITKLFNSQEYKDKMRVKLILLTYQSEQNYPILAKNFERLKDAFQNLLNLNALHKGNFSNKIYQLQTSTWSSVLFIIKDEILKTLSDSSVLDEKNKIPNILSDSSILNEADTKYLINLNFDLVNEADKFNNLIKK